MMSCAACGCHWKSHEDTCSYSCPDRPKLGTQHYLVHQARGSETRQGRGRQKAFRWSKRADAQATRWTLPGALGNGGLSPVGPLCVADCAARLVVKNYFERTFFNRAYVSSRILKTLMVLSSCATYPHQVNWFTETSCPSLTATAMRTTLETRKQTCRLLRSYLSFSLSGVLGFRIGVPMGWNWVTRRAGLPNGSAHGMPLGDPALDLASRRRPVLAAADGAGAGTSRPTVVVMSAEGRRCPLIGPVGVESTPRTKGMPLQGVTNHGDSCP